MNLQSKLPNVGESIFSIMSRLALQHHAVNLGQGFPDFEMNEQLIELVNKAMKDGHNQYAPAGGVSILKEAIAEKVCSLYNKELNPNKEICITPGATYAIYTAFTTILKPGDEVIVFEPAYDSYLPNIEINGAIPVLISLKYPDYKIDWEEVKSKITPATRMMIINSPHNPTGRVLDKSDIESLKEIVADTPIILISDEVYEHLIFDGKSHESFLKYPELYERSFITFSFGKVYNCTGWKTGYCIAPEYLMKEFMKVHQFNSFSTNSPMQYGLAEFLKNKNEYLDLGKSLQKKRDYFLELMKKTNFEPLASYGTYFQVYSYASISHENEIDFAKRLTKEAGVSAIPVSAFYRNNTDHQVLRFCFAKKEETLERAVERLVRL